MRFDQTPGRVVAIVLEPVVALDPGNGAVRVIGICQPLYLGGLQRRERSAWVVMVSGGAPDAVNQSGDGSEGLALELGHIAG